MCEKCQSHFKSEETEAQRWAQKLICPWRCVVNQHLLNPCCVPRSVQFISVYYFLSSSKLVWHYPYFSEEEIGTRKYSSFYSLEGATERFPLNKLKIGRLELEAWWPKHQVENQRLSKWRSPTNMSHGQGHTACKQWWWNLNSGLHDSEAQTLIYHTILSLLLFFFFFERNIG